MYCKIIPTFSSCYAGMLIETLCSHDSVVVTWVKSLKIYHVYTNIQLQSSKQRKIRCRKAVSNRHDFNYPCRRCYNLNSYKNIFGAIWHFNTVRSMKRCKIKTTGRNFKLRNMITLIKANCK